MPSSPSPGPLTAFRMAVNASGYSLFAAWGIEWREKKTAKAILEKLDRKRRDSSEEAYLEMLNSEINALKAELLNRAQEDKGGPQEAANTKLARD